MKARGFSLIELLIAIVIAGVLLALALPSFSSMLRNAKIRNLANSIVGGLNVAKTEAVRRNKLVSFDLPTDGSGWVVKEFASASPPPEPDEDEGGSSVPVNIPIQTQGSENVDTLKLVIAQGTGDSRVVLTAGSGVVTFNSLGRLVANSVDMEFDVESAIDGINCATVTNLDGARCLRVEVSSGGLIRMCDPALAAGNPQACNSPNTGA